MRMRKKEEERSRKFECNQSVGGMRREQQQTNRREGQANIHMIQATLYLILASPVKKKEKE